MTYFIPSKDQTLIHLAEHRDPSGAIERYLLGKLEEVKLQPECGHRHDTRLPANASELRVRRLITARPGAQQRRLPAPRRRAGSCIVQVPLETQKRRKRHQQTHPRHTLPGMLVLHLFGVQRRDSRQGPDPLGKPQPHLGVELADNPDGASWSQLNRDARPRHRYFIGRWLVSSATPRRDGKRTRQGGVQRRRRVVHDYQIHTHPIVGEYRVLQGGHDNWGFAVAGHHGKVQDSTVQRTRRQHARIVVHAVLL